MPHFQREEALRAEQKWQSIAGVDEAGRGPLAGPVVAAAVIFPPEFTASWLQDLNDSKKLTQKKRDHLNEAITNDSSVFWALGTASAQEIDTINILQATLLAMRRALEGLSQPADYALIDGRELPVLSIPGETLVKGDSKSYSIAAASIIAKVYRDNILRKIDQKFQQYGFAKHKGYGTKQHLAALREYGPTIHHRRSFRPVSLTVAASSQKTS